jgi:tetratricopeptide (TPR) repeat protein
MPVLLTTLQRYYERGVPLEAHLMIQRDRFGWLLAGSTGDPRGGRAAASEGQLRALRTRALEDFASAQVHKQFADALFTVGAYVEASAEYERAEVLQPGSVSKATLAAAQAKVSLDPQVQLAQILAFEEKLGVAPDHPQVKIKQLSQAQRSSPQRADIALRLGIELSKVGDEEGAAAQLRHANQLIQSGRALANNADLTQVLLEHLLERTQFALYKPPQIIRSPLFTVRFHPGEDRIFEVMAALERAQHIVYTSFEIPMSGTEVLLLRSQNAFQDYVNHFSEQPSSEFAQAVTISRSISGPSGLMPLSEEMITFASEGMDYFANLAHEYGHVAVRRFTSGSKRVPTWLSEGIACLVQGGYPDYRQRCQQAAEAGQLLPMETLLMWNVDGEQAFLAYSQANAIVEFIIAQRGKKALLQILDDLRRGVSTDQAFVRTLNLTQGQLFQRWAASLDR